MKIDVHVSHKMISATGSSTVHSVVIHAVPLKKDHVELLMKLGSLLAVKNISLAIMFAVGAC